MKKQKAYATLAAAMLITSLIATGCGNNDLDSTKDEKTTVMTVSGIDVPMEIYRYAALNLKTNYEFGKSSDIWLGEDGQELLCKFNDEVKTTIVNLYTTLAMCKDYGISTDDEYIENSTNITMENIYEEYDNDYDAYLADISEYHMNDSVYRFIVKNELLSDELFSAMIEKGEITKDDSEIKAAVYGDEFIRVKQVLISSDNGKTDGKNYSRAQEILSLAEKGQDFDELIKEFGEDLFMFNNSDGYYMTRGTYHRDFEDAAFSLDIGEISGIVKTDAGYSIIKRYEKDEKYLEKHFDDLKKAYQTSLYNLKLEAYRDTLTVTETEKLSDYSIFSMKAEH